MSDNKIKLKKRGNIFISIGMIALVVIFASIFFIYYQVNIIVDNIRNDLFYAANDAILSFDLQDLAYKKYTIDESKTKEVIEYILNKNYIESNGSITKIKVTDLGIIYGQDKVNLDIQVQVTFKSVINLLGKNEHSFKIRENVKIALMDYQLGE